MSRLLRSALVLLLVLAGGPGVAPTGAEGATKISDDLVALVGQHAVAVAGGVVFESPNPFLPAADDWVIIDAVASGDPNALAADLEALGAQDVVAAGRIVSARLPIPAIPMLETVPTLRFARPAYSVTNAGRVTTQGDRAMQADVTRSTFGLTGAGVTVGVLSNSFNCRGEAATDVADGDLAPVTVLQEEPGCSSGTDEGRAMLQIVHDVAPGANLAFATARGGQANFATNIQRLADAGARVIVDDLLYLAEPMFQDGIIAQAVDSVVARGVAYFSAAGNDARRSYDSAFVAGGTFNAGAFPGSPAFLGGTAHDFGGGDVFQRITIPGNSGFAFVLQWDSPFFSVSGVGTQTDLDFYFRDATTGQIVFGATTNNITSGDPVEIVSVVRTVPTAGAVDLMIVSRSGPNPGRIKYVMLQIGSPPTIQEFATNSGTIYGHANAQGAVAVGAASYRQTPEFGVSPPILQPFSAGGTTPVLFDAAGTRLGTPDLRSNKPQIVAPDGGDTTFFGSSDVEGNGFPNFLGTSAAAPHAAGVAALIFQASPTKTPAQLRTTLETTALDMGPAGFDNNSGFGLIQADAALDVLHTVAGITPNPVDLATTPANFTITGDGFGDRGFGPSVVNFMREGTLLGQARATAGTATALTVPFPTNATSLSGPLPGLSQGPVEVRVFNQTGTSSFVLVGSTTLTVNDTRPCALCVAGITPNPVDLATTPAPSFTIAGGGFANTGHGFSVVNFSRAGQLLGQARATAGTAASLTVPFPTNATSLSGPLPGLSRGSVTVTVFNQTGAGSFSVVGSITLTVDDTRPAPPPPGVSGITPNPVDLATTPAPSFTIAGGGFANTGHGFSVVNFSRAGQLLGQARATAGTATSLTVPFPTNATSLSGPLPGLSRGAVTVTVFNQTGAGSFSVVGSITLTVDDTRPAPPPPGVSGITPNPVDLATTPPPSFTIAGGGFANTGHGFSVVNFSRAGQLLGQARATAGTATSLTVPFPTNATSLSGLLPGLSAGPVQVAVFNQVGAGSFVLVGTVSLTVNDSRPCSRCVTGIIPSSIDLATPPVDFLIMGAGFAATGRQPVANFVRDGRLLGQARATLFNDEQVTIPFPTNATSLSGPLPGLSAGNVTVMVFTETAGGSFSLVGSRGLTVTDTRPGPPPPGVSGITPNPVDLASPPANFTIAGGFVDAGFGLPVVNFVRSGQLLGQARATAGTATSLTVPFPTNATSLSGPLPGLSAGTVTVMVFNQTSAGGFTLVGQTSLTVTDTRPVPGVAAIAPNPVSLAAPPTEFTLTGFGFDDRGFGLPVVNFMRAGRLLGQARATAVSGDGRTLTVPFPTLSTTLTPGVPGLSAGPVDVRVFVQTGAGSFSLLGQVVLTATGVPNVTGTYTVNLFITSTDCPNVPTGPAGTFTVTVTQSGTSVAVIDPAGTALTGTLDGMTMLVSATIFEPVPGTSCILRDTITWRLTWDPFTGALSGTGTEVIVANNPAACGGFGSCVAHETLTGGRSSAPSVSAESLGGPARLLGDICRQIEIPRSP